MSVSLISVIQERVSSATEKSKIAIFIVARGNMFDFNAVFDSTVATRKRISLGGDDYVGSYYRDSSNIAMLNDINNKCGSKNSIEINIF